MTAAGPSHKQAVAITKGRRQAGGIRGCHEPWIAYLNQSVSTTTVMRVRPATSRRRWGHLPQFALGVLRGIGAIETTAVRRGFDPRWAGAHRQRTRPIGLGVNQPAVWRAAARLRPSGRSAKTVHSPPGGTPGRRAGDRAAAGPSKGAGAAGARASRRCYARRPGCEVDPGGATTSDPGAKGGCAETGACQAKDVGTRGSWGQDGPGPGKPSSAADLAFH